MLKKIVFDHQQTGIAETMGVAYARFEEVSELARSIVTPEGSDTFTDGYDKVLQSYKPTNEAELFHAGLICGIQTGMLKFGGMSGEE